MIFDIIIAIVVIFFAIKYYREGLVNAIILFFSKIITFASAFLVAGKYAGVISEKYLKEKVYGYVDSIFVKNFDFTDIFEAFRDHVSTADQTAVELLLKASGTDIDALIATGSENAISVMRETVVNSVSFGFTYIAIFIIMIVAVTIAVSFIMSLVDIVFELPIIGTVNKLCGVALGIATGLLVSSLIVWTIITVMPVTTMDEGILNAQTIEDTYIIKHICNLTPSALESLIY